MKRPFSGAFLATFVFVLWACGGSPGANIPSPEDPNRSGAPPPTSTGDAPPANAALITLDVSVDGAGTIRSKPEGIDCPGHCSATFAPDTQVNLVTTASEGWTIDHWSAGAANEATCKGESCSVVLKSNTRLTSTLKLIDPRWDPSVGVSDCAAAWGNAGEKLSPCDTTPNDYVVVHKSKRNVALCKNGTLVKNLRSGLGFTPTGSKEKQGDGKTPEGVFYVPRLVPNSSYYKAFLISYPTPADAKRGAAEGLITTNERAQIASAHDACTEPSQSTGLGGEIGIHGNGSSEDWTHGCVALDDSSIDLLWSAIGVHDTIVVLP